MRKFVFPHQTKKVELVKGLCLKGVKVSTQMTPLLLLFYLQSLSFVDTIKTAVTHRNKNNPIALPIFNTFAEEKTH